MENLFAGSHRRFSDALENRCSVGSRFTTEETQMCLFKKRKKHSSESRLISPHMFLEPTDGEPALERLPDKVIGV